MLVMLVVGVREAGAHRTAFGMICLPLAPRSQLPTGSSDEEHGRRSAPPASPHRLMAFARQPPQSQAVIRTAAAVRMASSLPRSLVLAWASRAESLRDAPIEQHRAKLSDIFTSEKAARVA
jgi:hypothetical protein